MPGPWSRVSDSDSDADPRAKFRLRLRLRVQDHAKRLSIVAVFVFKNLQLLWPFFFCVCNVLIMF